MVTLRAIAPPAPRQGTPPRKTVRFVSPPRIDPAASSFPPDSTSTSEPKPKPTSHRLGPLLTRPPSTSPLASKNKTKRNPTPKLSTPLRLASRRAQVIRSRISRTARVLGKLARLIRRRAKDAAEEAKDASQCRCARDWFCPLHGFTAAAPPPRARGEARVIPSRRALPVELPVKAEGTGGGAERAHLRGGEGAGARWRAEHARCNPPPRTLRSRSPTPGPSGPRIKPESPAGDARAVPPTPATVIADAASDVLRAASPPAHRAQGAHEAARRARQAADMQWRYFALQVRRLRAGPVVPVPVRAAAEPGAEAGVEVETARNTAANGGDVDDADEVGGVGGEGEDVDDADADEAAVALSPSHDADSDADSDSDSDSDSNPDSEPTPWPWNDLHLGFAAPPAAHERDLDHPTRLAMFKVMLHLGRRGRADVEMLDDAFVMRNRGAAEIRRKELQEEEVEDDDEDEDWDGKVGADGCVERKTALPGAPAPPPPWYKGAGCRSR